MKLAPERRRTAANAALALFAAFAFWAAFAPLEWAWAPWVAWAPTLACLLLAADGGRDEARRAVRWAMLGAWLGWLATLVWIGRVTWIGWPFLAAYCALYCWPMLRFAASVRKLLVFLIGVAVLGVGGEGVRAWMGGGGGFPWNGLGTGAAGFLPVAQWAEWGGSTLISTLVYAVNAVLGWGIAAAVRRRFGWREAAAFAVLGALLAGGIAWGYRRLAEVDRTVAEATDLLPVAMVQPSIPQPDKWNEEKVDFIRERLKTLSAEALLHDPAPKLLVWPEAAFPDQGELTEDSLALLDAFVGKVPVLAGYVGVDFDSGGGISCANSALLFVAHPAGGVAAGGKRYDKRKLVLFGETVPVLRRLPMDVQCKFAEIGIPLSLTPGDRPARFPIPGTSGNLSMLICFEDTIPALARADALDGSRLLANLTNDAWFDDAIAPRQHLRNAILRAVETRLPLLRCANTGVTCVVSPSGRILAKWIGADGTTAAPGVLFADVPLPDISPTFFTRHGNLLSPPCQVAFFAYCAIIACLSWRRRRRGCRF